MDDDTCYQCKNNMHVKGIVSFSIMYDKYKFCSDDCMNDHIKKNEWDNSNLYEDVNPEMGNMMFGNSRGEHSMHRGLFSILFRPLLDKVDDCVYDNYKFENDVFKMEPYYWGDCTCGVEDEGKEDEAHKKECKLCQPNFIYKGSGFQIQWYKYPFRDSYCNKRLNIEEIEKMVAHCVESIKE